MMSGGSLPVTVRTSATGGSAELAQTSIAGRTRSPPAEGHFVHESSQVGTGCPESAVTYDLGGIVLEPMGRNSHHTNRGRSTFNVPPSALVNLRSSIANRAFIIALDSSSLLLTRLSAKAASSSKP